MIIVHNGSIVGVTAAWFLARSLGLDDGAVSFDEGAEDDAEAGLDSNCDPAELVTELAVAKAANVVRQLVQRFPGMEADRAAVVLAADTVAEWNGHILGKPTDEEHARRMLRMLSGRTHRVYTGVCLWPVVAEAGAATILQQNQNSESLFSTRVAVTTLRMDVLTDQQLDDYISGGQWQGKAGAFGYQDRLGWVHVLEGSESNVVGLPMDLVEEMLLAIRS